MLIIAHHDISKPDEFWSLAKDVTSSLPSTLKIHSVFPSKDLKTGTCVWEAPAVADVQNFLDEKVGRVSKNICYEVNEQAAMGTPKAMRETLV